MRPANTDKPGRGPGSRLRSCFLAALLLFGGAASAFSLSVDLRTGNWSRFVPFSRFNFGGEVSAQFHGFFNDVDSPAKIGDSNRLWDILTGRLKFSLLGPHADGIINLNLAPVYDGSAWPVNIDEAYLRFYFGSLQLEGGVRKLTWGKADSYGPLDVVNPLDYRNLTSLMDSAGRRKIGRPLLHLTWHTGDLSSLEAVFVPSFMGHRFADDPENRWYPRRLTAFKEGFFGGLQALTASLSDAERQGIIGSYTKKYLNEPINAFYPSTGGLNYFQAGLRYTFTLGPADFGAQYFFGNLFRPAVHITGFDTFAQNPMGLEVQAAYNRYHQIGLDYAQVLGGFNLRAEAAANITEDLKGSDGGIYNPFLGWSLGFDRDLFGGINLNLQGAGTIRLGPVGNPLSDIEGGTDRSSTRLILYLAKKFLQDRGEVKALGIWGIEDRDFFAGPSLSWTFIEGLSLEASGGYFGVFPGGGEGELGQYRDNGFVRLRLAYIF